MQRVAQKPHKVQENGMGANSREGWKIPSNIPSARNAIDVKE
jgi:hypothetical protein